MIDEVLPAALDNERIDRVVAMLDGCSRSVAAELIGNGGVTIDGEIVTQRSRRVRAGERVGFEPTVRPDSRPIADPQISFTTVYRDDDIAVIDKPAGLVVHPGAGHHDDTLVSGLLAEFPQVAAVGERDRPGIVHRLDADTSGLLVVALSHAAYEALVAAFARHDIERVYATVVDGNVEDDRGIIDAPIGRSSQRRTRMAVVADGREARTHYEVLARSPRNDASYLQCRLETGRTHQIRVHLAAIGHPVLGDPTYGTRRTAAAFERVALHATGLSLDHPVTGARLAFEAPLPADFRRLLVRLSLG